VQNAEHLDKGICLVIGYRHSGRDAKGVLLCTVRDTPITATEGVTVTARNLVCELLRPRLPLAGFVLLVRVYHSSKVQR
jgi:hypothetical protein